MNQFQRQDKKQVKQVKILFLAIYNETPHYIQMYNTRLIYMNFLKNNIHKTNQTIPIFYFILFKNLENKEYYLDDEKYILYIHGEETFLPGILDKTIKALDIFQNKLKMEYDFVVRSNISTFMNFENVFSYLSNFNNPKTEMYYIGAMQKVKWLDPKGGIVDKQYWGTIFASGVCIIMSSALVNNIINNREKLHYNIIDDVSIGHYISHLENVNMLNIRETLISFRPHCLMLDKTQLCYMNNFNKRWREIDCDNLRKIVNHFMKIEYR